LCNPPAGTEIICPLGNIAAGGSVVITLQLNVTASNGSAISVQSWLTADSDDLYVTNNASQQFVSVTPGALISINRNRHYFQTTTVGVSPADQTFQITNAGAGTLNWTLTASSSGGWLSASPPSGSGSATITVAVSAGSLPIGNYAGTITVSANALNSPIVLPVTFRVGPTVTGPYMISTIAGTNVIIEGGQALAQPLPWLDDVVFDSAGNLYFSSERALKVFKISPSGDLTTFAGNGQRGSGGDGGPATAAQLGSPTGLAVDAAGNIYIADGWNNRVRKVAAASGIITTFAGVGGVLGIGDGGPATLAALQAPSAIAFDGDGNAYVADTFNHRIRKIVPNGTITTIAGTGFSGNGSGDGDDGPATAANLTFPSGVTADAAGNVYFIDNETRVRKISAYTGIISAFAGTVLGCPSTGDGGPATSAKLCTPRTLSVDSIGNVYIGEQVKIRKVNTAGVISTIAGTGIEGGSGDGGLATSAQFSGINGLAVRENGDLFITDFSKRRIRQITFSDGKIQTVAGNGSPGGAGDGGSAASAQFYNPAGIAVDLNGNMYVADTYNHRVRKISFSGIITTMAGTGVQGFSGDGGPATSAQLSLPQYVAVDPSGNVYISDLNHRVRKVSPSGFITTVAGNGSINYSGDGGPATLAGLSPKAIAVDANGNLYIGDTFRVRRVGLDGIISTVAGTGVLGYSGDGGPATSAQMFSPTGLSLDSAGNLFIAEDYRVRKVSTDGTITTYSAGDFITVDAADSLFSNYFCVIGGLLSPQSGGFGFRVAGSYPCGFSGDGGPASAAEINVNGIAADDKNQIFFVDGGTPVIRKVTPIPNGSFTLTATPSLTFLPSNTFPLPLSVIFEGTVGVPTWTATKAVFSPSNGDWLTIDSTTGTGTSTINVSVNLSGLSAGFYSGTITISSPQAINGSVVVPVTLQVNNSPATLTSILPSTTPAGSADTVITVTGTNFVSGALVQFGETILNTTFVNSTQLTAIVPSGKLTSAGTYNVAVYNAAPGGGSSGNAPFNVTAIPGTKRRGQITSQ
jgi:sugar lactone lactonase YvrE